MSEECPSGASACCPSGVANLFHVSNAVKMRYETLTSVHGL